MIEIYIMIWHSKTLNLKTIYNILQYTITFLLYNIYSIIVVYFYNMFCNILFPIFSIYYLWYIW